MIPSNDNYNEREAIRRQIELAIEHLIARLDEMDGDPDVEANGDEHEPSLGAGEVSPRPGWVMGEDGEHVYRDGMSQTYWAEGDATDLELGDDNGIADMGGYHEQCAGFRGQWAQLPGTI